MKFSRLVSTYKKLLEKLIKRMDLKDLGQASPMVRGKKLLSSNWARLPNTRNFSIELKGNNTIMELLELDKRNQPKLYFEAHYNKKFNDYMINQLRRLEKIKSTDPEKYFRICFVLMRRSHVFRVSAMNHVFTNGHRKRPMGGVIKVNKKVNELLDTGATNLFIQRVYIPKQDGRGRPLGVPSAEGRIYLHMFNNFLQGFLKDELLESMHGYQPMKGTLTAGKQFFENRIHESEFIMEYDLKNFFPSIKHNYLEGQLEKRNVPKGVVKWIINFNKSAPDLPEDTKGVDESAYNEEVKTVEILQSKGGAPGGDGGLASREFEKMLKINPEDPLLHPLRQYVRRTNMFNGDTPPLRTSMVQGLENQILNMLQTFKTPSPEGKSQFPNLLHHLSQMEEGWGSTPLKFVRDRSESTKLPLKLTHAGVAQGSPTGPLLSNISLIPFLSQQPSLSYADDGIFYGNQEFTIWDQPNQGIKLHPEKTSWVKKGGQGLRPLKFLGLVYDGRNHTLRAETRNGSRLQLDGDTNAMIQAMENLEKQPRSGQSSDFCGEDIMKSKYIGYLQSRMYFGKGNIDTVRQDFTYNFVEHSWAYTKHTKEYRRDLDIFNSSSYASYSLINVFNRVFGKGRGPKVTDQGEFKITYVKVSDSPRKVKRRSGLPRS